MQLSTGLIIAGAYADKIRKTLFAQLRDFIKRGEVAPQEIARASAELNRILYYIIVDKLKSDKGDVIRARIEYEVKNGKIQWLYGTLRLEYFKRVADEEVSKVVESVVSNVSALIEKAVDYSLEKVLTTAYGDHIYHIKLDDRTVGSLIVTPINEEMAFIRGAVIEPAPVIIKRGRLMLSGRSIDDLLSENIAEVLKAGETAKIEEAERVLKDIEAVIEKELGEV